jgi:putative ABC transport system permease protein
MKNNQQHHPPAWAQRFIEWYCKPELAEDLTGDLHEYFERNVERFGVTRAKFIYIVDTFRFFRSYTVRRPTFINVLINWIMIGSYIKTSARNLMRNKLFSSINIVGLAISMSVGLLLIAFVLDLNSYDRFHEKGQRIYRITTKVSNSNREQQSKYGTTSFKAGRLIREKVKGIEEVAILRNDFSQDATVGDVTLPISGFWAEPSMLKMMTFPLIEGNTNTALKDPYSIVLTEKAAKKLFGDDAAIGKAITFDSIDYQVTGILKDIPFFSHITFEALVSHSTAEQLHTNDRNFDKWTTMWTNSVYVSLPAGTEVSAIQSQLDVIAKEENTNQADSKIELELLPLYDIVVGENLGRSHAGPVAPHMSPTVLWILGALALVVILSACFNYTNLSMARAMRRFKEVGLRKAIGAGKNQVRQQFLTEAIMISLAAVVIASCMFLLLRPQLINMAPELQRLVKLELTPTMVAAFIFFSVVVGVIAGFIPALFFSKVNAINALRNISSVKVFKHIPLRRALIVVQYTATLIFITTTAIGYVQYKNVLEFDLGFKTENILNINMHGSSPDELIRELNAMPEVTAVSKSFITTGVGNAWGGNMKYQDSRDSSLVLCNYVDENYLPLHEHKLVAGGNFIARPATAEALSEVIVNEQVLKRFNIGAGNPEKAVGEEVTLNGKKMTIVGVMEDFHYGTVDNIVGPVVYSFWTPERRTIVNAKIQSDDIRGTVSKIESTWKKIDRVHPFEASFYEQQIEEAYSEFSSIIKIIGFLSLLAVSIASMGLFGMVIFTTETRLKEIGIRKVLGASPGSLIMLLTRGFLILLTISAMIALPLTYIIFERFVLTNFPYHTPVQLPELFLGLVIVLVIAFIMIGSQTVRATRVNPSRVLKND